MLSLKMNWTKRHLYRKRFKDSKMKAEVSVEVHYYPLAVVDPVLFILMSLCHVTVIVPQHAIKAKRHNWMYCECSVQL